ncbi:MAG: sulfatase-like hydrolase/transferase [Pseudomonadales bacterium]|nr:sulfatase-like hydrolase/transferase [Pseudomonadales bacterium]
MIKKHWKKLPKFIVKHSPEIMLLVAGGILLFELFFRRGFVRNTFGPHPLVLACLPTATIFAYKTIFKRWPIYFKYTGVITLIIGIISLGVYLIIYNFIRPTEFNYRGLIAVFSTSILFFLTYKFSTIKSELRRKIFPWILFIVLPFLTFILIETFNNYQVLAPSHFFSIRTFQNTLLLVGFFGLVVAAVNNLLGGYFIILAASIGLGMANFFKLINREEPLFLTDLRIVREVAGLNQAYLDLSQLNIRWYETTIFLLTLGFIIYAFFLTKIKFRLKLKKRLTVLFVSLAIIIGVIVSRYHADYVFYTNITQLYRHRGLLIALIDNHFRSRIRTPEITFTRDEMRQVVSDFDRVLRGENGEEYDEEELPPHILDNAFWAFYATKLQQREDEEEEIINPNVIVIMNESFFDLGGNNSRLDTSALLSYFHRFVDEGFGGNMISPVFAGDTSIAEFEFLTGHNASFFPVGLQPYVYFINQETFALPWLMRQRNYRTWALHPFHRDFWSRNVIYPRLGFENFTAGLGYFRDLDLSSTYELFPETPMEGRTRYPSDTRAVRKLIYDLENSDSDDGKFIFLVTMQNHGPFNASGLFTDEDREVVAPLLEEFDFSDDRNFLLSNYLLNLLGANESLELLHLYLTLPDAAPTIVLFFSDHQPGLQGNEAIFEELGIQNDDGSPLGRHTVPFFIWSNFKDVSDIGAEFVETMDMEPIHMYQLSTILLHTLDFSIPDYWKLTTMASKNEGREMWEFAQYQIIFGNNYFDKFGNLKP